MIKHIVMWNLKDNALGNEKDENAVKMKEQLEGLQGKIQELQKIEVGINILPSPQSFDVVLYSEFKSVEDLNTYQNHPEHLKIVGFIRQVVSQRVACDYEL